MTSWGPLIARHWPLASGKGVKRHPTVYTSTPVYSSRTPPLQDLLVCGNIQMLFFLPKHVGFFLLIWVLFFCKDLPFLLVVFIPYLWLKAQGLRIRISALRKHSNSVPCKIYTFRSTLVLSTFLEAAISYVIKLPHTWIYTNAFGVCGSDPISSSI